MFKRKPKRFKVGYNLDHVVNGQEFWGYVITDTRTGRVYTSDRCYSPNAKSQAKEHVNQLERTQNG